MKALKLIFVTVIVGVLFITCVIGKEMTFDISQLQVTGNRVLLNITNSGDQILY